MISSRRSTRCATAATSDLVAMRAGADGLDDPVIDSPQTTYLDTVRDDQSREDADAWTGIDGWWHDRLFEDET